MKNGKVKRVIKDMTQTEMADYLGITQTAYSIKESGKIKFTIEEAIKLGQLFNLTVEELFNK